MGMDNIVCFVGETILILGGGILAAGIIGLLGWLACLAWTLFSVTFRKICKAEILIVEYRKNREKFLEWRAKDGN